MLVVDVGFDVLGKGSPVKISHYREFCMNSPLVSRPGPHQRPVARRAWLTSHNGRNAGGL